MGLTWKQAIVDVLQGADQALHYTEITSEIITRGLRDSIGATPADTVGSILSVSINNHGENSLFMRTGTGMYMLRSEPGTSSGELKETDQESEAQDPEVTPRIINAHGMFWRRSFVDWKSKPALLGKQGSKSEPVDFGPQLGVYLLHDGQHTVYVGRATERPMGQRLYEHCSDRLNGRWDRFSWFGLKRVLPDGSLCEPTLPLSQDDWISTLESLLIEALEPPLNRRRGDDFTAIEYLQVKGEKVRQREFEAEISDLLARRDTPSE